MKTVLVTGGAGYIGSVAVKKLIEKKFNVIVIDNLSRGLKELINEKANFYKGDLCDKDFLEKVFSENKIESVIHFAGYKAVGESMKNATKYSQNISGTINLLDTMNIHCVKRIIFSSTAAVYGTPKEKIIDETCETNPINYYGFTKLTCENLIKWYSEIYGLKYCILRYFNVAGDGGLNYIDPYAENIIPIIMEFVFEKRNKLTIFGDDYDTRDGTGIRDYLHVSDLINAHILALDLKENQVINLGTSSGTSVKELVHETEKIIGKKIDFEIKGRRTGDPDMLTTSNKKAKEILGWIPKRDVKDIIYSTWEAYRGIN